MILNEVSKECGISAVRSDRVDHVVEVADTSAGTLESIQQLVVTSNSKLARCVANIGQYLHWIVEHSIQVILVRACVSWISIKDLTDTVDTCSVIVVWPEGFLDMLHGINAKTIDWSIVRP